VSADPENAWADQLRTLLPEGAEVDSTVFGDLTVGVLRERWVETLRLLRSDAALEFFDWLSAVHEADEGFTVYCHLYDAGTSRHALVSTRLPPEDPSIESATPVFRGAAWHERETAEMFGITIVGREYPPRLLLAEEFEGHPLRKDFVLTARVSKSWPGAKEPGESGSPSRRKMQPPGVPDPAWGPRDGEDSRG
jgi:NADH:ubiquinone oxidoreductase subunit C